MLEFYKTINNVGQPDHIGMIYEVHDNYVMVIEGNTGSPSHVGTRKLEINGWGIRGICAPDYASMAGKIVKTKIIDGTYFFGVLFVGNYHRFSLSGLRYDQSVSVCTDRTV